MLPITNTIMPALMHLPFKFLSLGITPGTEAWCQTVNDDNNN